MHADAFFAIGASHLVCQDYARAGTVASKNGRPATPYAIVSDGCSSSPDSDFGARFLTAAAVRCLRTFGAGFDPAWTIRESWRPADDTIGASCLDATLFVAFLAGDRNVHVCGYGDGVVIARHVDGSVAAWDVSFNEGAPGYLSYLLDDERLARYAADGYGKRTVGKWRDGRPLGEADHSAIVIDGSGVPTGFCWEMAFEPGSVDLVLLSTDGIHSFRKMGGPAQAAVHFWQVVEQLLDIKTFTGSFLARRCRRFLTRFCVENGWQHQDDFGVAAIRIAD